MRRGIRLCAGAALSGLLIGAAACAVNPATGERQLMFVSQEQEIAIGRENDPAIVAQMGLHPDSSLQRYVRELGLELAATSELPDLPWTVRLLDDPVINAFALPGGFVYVTRGILANMTSEAQLAGVLGHEIGHVTARHSAAQMTRQQLIGGGLLAGALFSETVRENFELFGAGAGILNLSYGRGDELQADRLGIRYMNNEGYDPRELADVMAMLGQSSRLQPGGRSTPEWLSTHPDPDNRVDEIQEEIRVMGIEPGGIVRDDEFVRRLDGMIFGVDPREGYVEDDVFHHPELRFRFDLPSGWQVQNGKQSVVAASQEGQFILTLASQSADEAFRAFAAQQGLTMTSTSRAPVNGIPAVGGDFSAVSEGTRLRGAVLFLEYGGNVYRMLGLTTQAAAARVMPALDATLGSFREETDPAVLATTPDRIEVVELAESMDFADFLARYPSEVEPGVVALMNQVSVDGRIGPGAVKRVVNR